MQIAIVGAGPAGAMAAIRLARAGASVTVFDASHPREKPCGGGVTGRALGLIGDAVDLGALPAVTVQSAIAEDPSAPIADSDAAATVALVDRGVSPASSLVVLSRAVFDRALIDAAQRAGATLIPEKVIDVTRSGSTMSIRTASRTMVAHLVIGADGANSLVRKRVAAPFVRREISIAAGYFVHGARDSAITIRSMQQQPGYLWAFPRRDHLAVGVCAPAQSGASSSDLRRQSRGWIESHGLHHGARLEPYAWPIPSAGFSPIDGLCAAGHGWMLLGDAAGLVDPLTREGIYYALLSGIWAADAVVRAGRRPAERDYAERIRQMVYPELSRASRLSRLFFSPEFSSLFVAALRESAPIREVFADLVAGIQPYRGLRRRLLRTAEWRLARRALRLVVQ